MVGPSEGNEVRSKGLQGVGASRSTREVGGTLSKGTRWREGDAGAWNRCKETR